MGVRDWLRRRDRGPVTEATATRAIPASAVQRAGFEAGIPPGGIDEYRSALGASTQTDRRTLLTELFEAYVACPWAWSCVQAIARTITAGGLVMDWVTDTGEGDQEQPEKSPQVLALERLIEYVNPRQDIRQLLRSFIVDLLVFGDAFIEVVWWGSTPVALYNLDSATTTPVADEHGKVSGYVQVTDYGQTARFEERDVIHVSLDAPRSGIFGLPPMQAALLPVTTWLHAAATGKEMMRKGLPPEVHADFPSGTSDNEVRRWRDRYMVTNVGPRNIGAPRVTKGGATLTEMQAGKPQDVLAAKDQSRDEILAAFGVPPAKATVIESGNLGGGTGEEQDKSFKIDVCAPVAELVLGALNFAVTRNGFGIADWRAKFRDVDYRASKVVEDIRDTRIRNGTYSINKARTEIGEPPVDGGDDAVIIDRQNLVLVKDLARMSEAQIAGKGAPAVAAGEVPPGGEHLAPGQPPPPLLGQPAKDDEEQLPGVPAEAYARYRARLREALRVMPGAVTEAAGDAGTRVRAQLAANFPPSSVKWTKGAEWAGPAEVPIGKVDVSDRDHWDASSETAIVKAKQRKLRKKLAAGEKPKPVILVRRPSGKLLIADGHHRFLAAEAEGLTSVWAYVGTVDEQDGDWNQMAMSEDRAKDAAA